MISYEDQYRQPLGCQFYCSLTIQFNIFYCLSYNSLTTTTYYLLPQFYSSFILCQDQFPCFTLKREYKLYYCVNMSHYILLFARLTSICDHKTGELERKNPVCVLIHIYITPYPPVALAYPRQKNKRRTTRERNENKTKMPHYSFELAQAIRC